MANGNGNHKKYIEEIQRRIGKTKLHRTEQEEAEAHEDWWRID